MGRGEVGAAQGSLIGKLPRTSGILESCPVPVGFYQWDSLGFFGDLDRHYSLGSSFHSSVWQRHNIILMEIPHTTH
jgi:hypothetical protein